VVSEVKQHISSYEKKKIYVFRIFWPEAIELTETYGSNATPLTEASSSGDNQSGGTLSRSNAQR